MFGLAEQGGKAGLRLWFITTFCSQNSHPSDSTVKFHGIRAGGRAFPCSATCCPPPHPISHHTSHIQPCTHGGWPGPAKKPFCPQTTYQQPDSVKARQLGDEDTNFAVLHNEESCSEAALWQVFELGSLEMDKTSLPWGSERSGQRFAEEVKVGK